MGTQGHEAGGTKDAILHAARQELSSRGYDGATIRGVARRAGVDPRLVRHYFHDKPSLIGAALQADRDQGELAQEVSEGEPAGMGDRLVAHLLAEASTEHGPTALTAAALSDPLAARHLAEWLSGSGLADAVREVAPDHPEVRTTLVAAHVLGLGLLQQLVPTDPLPEIHDVRLVELVGEAVQRLLTEPLR